MLKEQNLKINKEHNYKALILIKNNSYLDNNSQFNNNNKFNNNNNSNLYNKFQIINNTHPILIELIKTKLIFNKMCRNNKIKGVCLEKLRIISIIYLKVIHNINLNINIQTIMEMMMIY